MAVNRKIAIPLLVIFCIGWAVFTMRVEALILALLFPLFLVSRRFRCSNVALFLTTILIAAIPFFPIGLTLQRSLSGPNVVECCPARFVSPELNQAAKESAGRGECHLCSDLQTGFEPKRYLVW